MYVTIHFILLTNDPSRQACCGILWSYSRPRVSHLTRLVRLPTKLYSYLHILTGGDVNITDEDGDTPLYVVENVETARYLVEHGATINRRNHEDMTVCH